MRSSRGSDSSRYKILFIIAILLIAILGVLFVMKWQEAATLSETLVETQAGRERERETEKQTDRERERQTGRQREMKSDYLDVSHSFKHLVL